MQTKVAEEEASRTARQTETNRMLREAQHTEEQRRRRLVEAVVVRNLPVARAIALRYRDRGIPLDDLEQVAYLALVRAASKFDPDKAEDFLTYAVPTIRGELKRYFRDQGWTVRPPRRVQEAQTRILSSGHGATDGRPETAHEITRRLGIDPEDAADALAAQGCFHPTSLDAPIHDGGEPMGHAIAHLDSAEYDAVEARVVLRTVARTLTARDRQILYLRFFEDLTQAEIGEEIGVTQMQVSRLLSRILRTLRSRLDAGHGEVDGTDA